MGYSKSGRGFKPFGRKSKAIQDVSDGKKRTDAVNVGQLEDAIIGLGSAISEVLTGGVITVETIDGSGTLDDIKVTASTYFIVDQGSFSASETFFLNIALSTAGTQRYIGIYGTTSSTITKVEGTEAALASFPAQPANTVLFGYLLVSDAAVSTTPDLSGYLQKSEKSTPSMVATGTDDATYMTPYSHSNAKTVTTITTSTTPTPAVSANVNITDEMYITALASAATFGAPTGTLVNGKMLIVRCKDNGTARALLFNAVYRFSTDLPAPNTTILGKVLYIGAKYNSTDLKWDVLAIQNNY